MSDDDPQQRTTAWPDNLRGLDREPVAAAPAARAGTPTRDELAAVLERLGGSVRATARHFGRDRRQIYRWLDAHGLRGARD
jgi:transcriptional regulator of acetoin/glycerol metabolism